MSFNVIGVYRPPSYDLIFSNKPERIIKSYNLLTGLSDHNMTLIARKLTKKRTIYQREIIKNSYGIRKHDMNAFKEELSQTDWRDVLFIDDIDASCESFIGTINKLLKMDGVRAFVGPDEKT